MPTRVAEPLRILIADDSQFHRILLKRALEANGFEVVTAEDGLHASMLALRTQPKAIVLDVSMPGGSGLEVLKRLRRSEKTKAIPVIVFTGDASSQTREVALGLGAYEVLPKTTSPTQLARRLFELLSASSTTTCATSASDKIDLADSRQGFSSGIPLARRERSWPQIIQEVVQKDRKLL